MFQVVFDVLLVSVLRRLVPGLQQPTHVVVLLHELHLPLADALHLHGVEVRQVVVLVQQCVLLQAEGVINAQISFARLDRGTCQ